MAEIKQDHRGVLCTRCVSLFRSRHTQRAASPISDDLDVPSGLFF
jgi:hypothetical protein